MTLFTLSLMFFLIMDPFGNVSSYLKLVEKLPRKRQFLILGREMLIALGFMLLFNFIGEYLFDVLHISETAIRLASGLILFLAALKILFPSIDSPRANLPEGEPFIIPLAVPLIAGPALLATIMLYTTLEPSQPLVLGAIFLSWVAASIVMFSSSVLYRILGTNGLIACEKLMGMVLILLAIERFSTGVQLFITGKCCL
ncbi:MAG: MarC family protein [Parachlamydiaceae bacterium]